MTKKSFIGSGLILAAAGFVAGILTAPRSGRRTRDKLKKAADLKPLENELKTIYEETKKDLEKLSKDHPKLSAKLDEAKKQALNSQERIQDILKAASGKSGADEDLKASLTEAKKALDSLKKYLSK